MTARAFRNAAAQICTSRKYSFRVLRANGLDEILETAEDGGWAATEIAAQFLARLCVEEGKFNNFQVGLLAVMTYLNGEMGDLGGGRQQAWKDLVQVLNTGGSIEAIRRWMETHYH